jgi:hypothetical protein
MESMYPIQVSFNRTSENYRILIPSTANLTDTTIQSELVTAALNEAQIRRKATQINKQSVSFWQNQSGFLSSKE